MIQKVAFNAKMSLEELANIPTLLEFYFIESNLLYKINMHI